jgi:hypothetical protein
VKIPPYWLRYRHERPTDPGVQIPERTEHDHVGQTWQREIKRERVRRPYKEPAKFSWTLIVLLAIACAWALVILVASILNVMKGFR